MRRAGGGALGSRFERSARFWLRAYPRRWRRERADEVVGVLLELAGSGAERAGADSPGAAVLGRGVGARTVLDLVRHGWATRLREHPPLHRWLAYRLLDVDLPRRYRDWAADDIDGALYMVRAGAVAYAMALFVLVNNALQHRISLPVALLPLAIGLLGLHPDLRRRRRRLARERHLVAGPGEPLEHGAYVAMGEPRRRRPSSWAAPRALAMDVVALTAGVVAALLAPQAIVGGMTPDGLEITAGPPGALRPAFLGLLAFAAIGSAVRDRRVRRSLATLVASLPAQPDRVVEVPSRRQELWFLAYPGSLLALAAFELVVTRTAVLSPALAVAAAAHLPRTLALAAAARRAGYLAPDGSPLAWCDLTVIAATRRPPVPDLPQRVVRRWDGPTVPGQVVLGPRAYTAEDREPGDPFRLA